MEYDDSFEFDELDDGNQNNIPNIPNMQGFLITPKGPIPINNNTLLDLMNMPRNEPICTILNGEYVIYLVSKINDNVDRFLFECVQNSRYDKPFKYSLFDAYEYLNTTHFLNFLLSRKFGKNIWAYEGISLQMQIFDSKKESYSKIMIMVEPSDCADWVSKYSMNDMYSEKITKQINAISGIPIIATIIKSKSYYTPLMTFDINFGLNTKSDVNFDSIHLSNFYNIFIKEFIEDAKSTFYFGYKHLDHIRDLGERLIRVNFDISCSNKIMNIRLICTPSVYINNISKKLHNYSFTSSGHLISTSPINDDTIENGQELMPFANNICSSKHSQLITLTIYNRGAVSQYCEDYVLFESLDILCTQERLLFNANDKFAKTKNYEKNRIFSSIYTIPSKHDGVANFWKVLDSINITLEEFHMEILGFINFNTPMIIGMKYSEMIPNIYDEIQEIYDIDVSDFANDNIKVMTCYETVDICRVMIYTLNKSNTPDKYSKKNKKKFRLFGGEKS